MNEAAATNSIGPATLKRGRLAFSLACIIIIKTKAHMVVRIEAHNQFFGIVEIPNNPSGNNHIKAYNKALLDIKPKKPL